MKLKTVTMLIKDMSRVYQVKYQCEAIHTDNDRGVVTVYVLGYNGQFFPNDFYNVVGLYITS